jgi:16S rRNA (cytosine1402-N4)-methyltransferase
MPESIHIAVLTNECLDLLEIQPGGHYLDGTLGGGTHTSELLRLSAPNGVVVSLDVDPSALSRAQEKFAAEKKAKRWIGVEQNFRHLAEVARETGIAPLDGILIDLGFSSDQLADTSKGISFLHDAPLDMRLGPSIETTAAEIVNGWRELELADLIREYGEERFARRIAAAIVAARKHDRIITTSQLVDIIGSAVPSSYEHHRIHPATRTFQALRIAVNDELGVLKAAIEGAHEVLKVGGRLGIISFHSLEDRICKQAFKKSDQWTPVTKKPVIASEQEMAENPRSRSAKLRVAIKR